jgi:hypothetical protein
MPVENSFSLRETDQKREESNGFDLERIIAENANETTFHSIDKIYKTKDLFLKLTLFVCFMTSGGFCSYLTVNTFIDYFSYHVLISTSIISEIPVDCNVFL